MSTTENKGVPILCIDDEAVVSDGLKRMLNLDGHTVQTATCGVEALAQFEDGKFDLVFLDYEMPDMRGDELALLIKALAPKQPIVMVTAYPKTLEGSLLTEVELIISKPFDPQELRSAAKKLLKKG